MSNASRHHSDAPAATLGDPEHIQARIYAKA